MLMSRSVRKTRIAISPRLATSTFVKAATGAVFCPVVGLADQLTLARIASVPLVVALYVWGFPGHDYWATGVFAAAGAWPHHVAWWGLLVAVALTWISGLDYARVAPGLLRGRGVTA